MFWPFWGANFFFFAKVPQKWSSFLKKIHCIFRYNRGGSNPMWHLSLFFWRRPLWTIPFGDKSCHIFNRFSHYYVRFLFFTVSTSIMNLFLAISYKPPLRGIGYNVYVYLDFEVPEHHIRVHNKFPFAPHLLSPTASSQKVALHLLLASPNTYRSEHEKRIKVDLQLIGSSPALIKLSLIFPKWSRTSIIGKKIR